MSHSRDEGFVGQESRDEAEENVMEVNLSGIKIMTRQEKRLARWKESSDDVDINRMEMEHTTGVSPAL